MSYRDAIINDAHDPLVSQAVQKRLDDLTKPPGSLGRLEETVMAYCLARNTPDAQIKKSGCYVFAADHGITAEGVAPYPRDVTVQMVRNMLSGGAAVSIMCRNAGVDCRVVNMGVDGEFGSHPLLINRAVARGTGNFRHTAAMSETGCAEAIDAGYELGLEAGADICLIGEMGIGNSSSASALYSLILGKDVAQTVGRGTGSEGPRLETKRRVIAESVSFHSKQWDNTPFDALRRVGGFEIAGMTGFIIGCAAKRIPVIVDGFIATAAALCAIRMFSNIGGYLFFGHASQERFHKQVLESIGMRPILDLDMWLGEGTGAVLALNVITQALNCYHQMATFTSAGVSNRGD